MRRVLILSSVVLLSFSTAAACGGSSTDDTGSTQPGAGGSSGGVGGSNAAGSSAAGAGGSSAAGAGGSSAGAGGSSAGAGGSSAGSGGSSAGAGGAPVAKPQCQSDSDCQLENDCCACAGLPKTATLPSCPGNCLVASCTPLKVQAAQCRAGQCVTEASCDQSKIACATPAPTCSKGQLPTVTGGCWGGCIDATQCSRVTSCADCAGAGLPCVQYDAQAGPEAHCVKAPAPCTDVSCACMGPAVCTNGYGLCAETSKQELHCSCPTCLRA